MIHLGEDDISSDIKHDILHALREKNSFTHTLERLWGEAVAGSALNELQVHLGSLAGQMSIVDGGAETDSESGPAEKVAELVCDRL